MSDATSTILEAGGDIQPEAIEETLRGLWQDMVNQNTDVTQVRMLNLLGYFPDSPSADVRKAINAVAVQHPGRAITLIPDKKPPRVETSIACRTGGEKLRACGEQIILRGTVNGQPIHSLAIALLLGGLPITIWWHGNTDFNDHIFHQLAATADHIVLDSRTWTDANTQLRELARMLHDDNHHTWISDLRWVALTSWRRIIAHSFDVTIARQALRDIGEITIGYGNDESAILDAIYLASWWISRTGRLPTRVEHNSSEIVIRTRAVPGKEHPNLRIALRPADRAGSIDSIELLGTGTEYVHVMFDKITNKSAVRTTVKSESRPVFEQVSSLGAGDLTSLLNTELSSVMPDPTYEGALDVAGKILETL